MKIRRTIYNQIISFCPLVPPEVGGIIGSSGKVIDSVVFDIKYKEYNKAVYIPNTDNLNKIISQWNEDEIYFMGLFHSHPVGQETLSGDDIEYIKSIFNNMPESVKELYFPIVIPKSHICSYKAINQNHRIVIVDDKIDLVS